ncbi:hypothetical protein Lgee_1571 [Legionella geestiana]|uniref:Uncharacterized protein n=1 Tax=Legionella geestiana TaxID=45065 RepID=A0A0W0TSP6_9GAMM|nr:hypothetical protein [Legionella geestiana]KTC98494.1 hypothetical protein Lgee_1571 [Legionella geestiana]QBS13102.1 hypothetical protein E4T54_10330 [Legionella geestiana]STX54383.1 Uncharacterised protein [Legionella geestiana]
MKSEALIALYPWANIEQVTLFSEDLSDEEWMVLDKEGVGDFVSKHKDNPKVNVFMFFTGILACSQLLKMHYDGGVPLDLFANDARDLMTGFYEPQDCTSPSMTFSTQEPTRAGLDMFTPRASSSRSEPAPLAVAQNPESECRVYIP